MRHTDTHRMRCTDTHRMRYTDTHRMRYSDTHCMRSRRAWGDYESLFLSAAAVCPRSAKVQYNLAHHFGGMQEAGQA
jgi:hypothetical protein